MLKGTKLKVFKAVGRGFAIPHKNPSMFMVSAIYSAIMSTFLYFTTAFYQPGEEPDLMSSITGILSLGEYLLFFLVVGIVAILSYVMLSKMAFDSLDSKPELSEAAALSVGKFLPVLAMYSLYFLIVMFGSILLIIPGIFLSIMLIYSQYFIIFENNGIIESFRSSWQIVIGNWWRTAALFFIWTIVGSVSSFIVYMPRMTETIINFVLYLLVYPWTISSFVYAYTQLKFKTESHSTTVQS